MSKRENASIRFLNALNEQWNEHGDAIFPITAYMTKGFKSKLNACYHNTRAGDPMDISKLETDVGTVILEVVDDFVLVFAPEAGR